jgi:hypothetical protein
MSKNGSVTAETHRAVKRKVANLRAELATAEMLLANARPYVRGGELKEEIGLFLVRLQQRD